MSKRAQTKRLNRQAGMTLVELLVVLTVIALITAVAAPRLLRYVGGAKASTAQTQIENLVSAVELYFLETGQYPTEEQGLSILVTPPVSGGQWNGPYLRKAGGTVDPWGNPYKYRVPGRFVEFEIYSFGSDGVEGGEGDAKDINSWDNAQ